MMFLFVNELHFGVWFGPGRLGCVALLDAPLTPVSGKDGFCDLSFGSHWVASMMFLPRTGAECGAWLEDLMAGSTWKCSAPGSSTHLRIEFICIRRSVAQSTSC